MSRCQCSAPDLCRKPAEADERCGYDRRIQQPRADTLRPDASAPQKTEQQDHARGNQKRSRQHAPAGRGICRGGFCNCLRAAGRGLRRGCLQAACSCGRSCFCTGAGSGAAHQRQAGAKQPCNQQKGQNHAAQRQHAAADALTLFSCHSDNCIFRLHVLIVSCPAFFSAFGS